MSKIAKGPAKYGGVGVDSDDLKKLWLRESGIDLNELRGKNYITSITKPEDFWNTVNTAKQAAETAAAEMFAKEYQNYFDTLKLPASVCERSANNIANSYYSTKLKELEVIYPGKLVKQSAGLIEASHIGRGKNIDSILYSTAPAGRKPRKAAKK